MNDAASCNNLKGFGNIIHANCLAHARRKFSEIEDVYPEEAQIVIDAIALVYRFDTQCQIQQLREAALSSKAQRAYHGTASSMAEIIN